MMFVSRRQRPCRLRAVARSPHFLNPLLGPSVIGLRLVRPGDPAAVVATHVESAFDSATRRRGLLGRTCFDEGGALVIAPSGAVHTFGMRFAIDLVYTRRDGRIMKLRETMVPNRLSVALGAFAVIELPAGTIARTGLRVGDVLELR